MPGILNPAVAQAAFDQVAPFVATYMAQHSLGGNLAVVMTGTASLNPPVAGRDFRESCYCIASIGDRASWTIDLEAIALNKAEKSVRTWRDTAGLAPHYLLEGDTLSWGSVVLDGIVVACSGVKPWYDEMFAMWFAAAIRAACKQLYADLEGKARKIE